MAWEKFMWACREAEHSGPSEVTNPRALCLPLNQDRTRRSSPWPKTSGWELSTDGEWIGVEGRYLPDIVCSCLQCSFCCHVQWYSSPEFGGIAWVFPTATYCLTGKTCTSVFNRSFKNTQVPVSYEEQFHSNFGPFPGSFMDFWSLPLFRPQSSQSLECGSDI